MMFEEGKIVKNFKAGSQNIVLRFLKIDDVDDCLALVNSLIDEKAGILLQEKKNLDDEFKWLKSEINNNKLGHSISLVVEVNNKVVGLCNISKQLAEHHATEHVASIGFSVHKGFRRLGIGKILTATTIDLAKKKWNIEIVRSDYYSNNIPSATLHEKLGFLEIGRIKNGVKVDGNYVDNVIVIKKL